MRKVLFFALSVTFLFVYEISRGTAERICAKFTGKTCFVPRSEEFERQGQRSKVKVTRDKNGIFGPFEAVLRLVVGELILMLIEFCF